MSVIKSAVISAGVTPVGSLTSPTFTVSADGQGQYQDRGIVTTLGGTQTNGRVHTISDPFAITWKVPQNPKSVGVPDANGVLRSQPKNSYHGKIIKGMIPLAGQAPQIGTCDISLQVPAGCEKADPVAIDQMVAAAIAFITTWRADILVSTSTGSK